VAAGLVWSAPAVRSAQRLAAGVGTPPPSPSTSGQPTVRHYTFSGDVTERTTSVSAAGAPCIIGTLATFTADLTTIGTTAGSFNLCLTQLPQPGPVPVTAEGSMSTATGTLTCTATGSLAVSSSPSPSVVAWDVHLDIDITGGTGEYEGATGSASYDLDETLVEQSPNDFIVTFIGSVSGSFDVPA
jgi:hypothetical protein